MAQQPKKFSTPTRTKLIKQKTFTIDLIKLPVFVLLFWLLVMGPFFTTMTKFENGQVLLADDFRTEYLEITSGSCYLSFEGPNSLINLGTLGSWWSQNGSNFSYEMIVDIPSGGGYVINYYNGATGGLELLYNRESKDFITVVYGNDGKEERNDLTSAGLSGISKLKIEYSNFEIKYFINDSFISSSNIKNQNPSTFSNLTTDILIGALSADGLFDMYDLKIYNGSNLFLHYDFSECSGNTLNDLVNSNDATISNATWNGVPTSTIIDRSYYQIMENARIAEYGNPFEFITFILSLPRLISETKPLAFLGINTTTSEMNDAVQQARSITSLGNFRLAPILNPFRWGQP